MYGSYSYASMHFSEIKCLSIHWDLKGKGSLMIFDRYRELKYRYGNRKFWCRGYYVDTVGINKK